MVIAAQQRITVNMRLHDDQWRAYLVHASNECSDTDVDKVSPPSWVAAPSNSCRTYFARK